MVVEVYATYDLSIMPHLLLSLVLYKMVDPHSVSSKHPSHLPLFSSVLKVKLVRSR